jgi:hypothetical protein
MNYVLNEEQYRKLIASIYTDLEYDNYRKSRIIRLVFGKKYNKTDRRAERYPRPHSWQKDCRCADSEIRT